MANGDRILTPQAATLNKNLSGISDTSISGRVYKFMGCSVTNVNMTMGFNGTPSSLSISLVSDPSAGDSFVSPTIPSIWAMSLPRGGVGQPYFYDNYNFNPDDVLNSNVPFYFAGICTGYSVPTIDTGGWIISVNIVDPREILSGVECLLNGFSLSQQIGAGSRYNNVFNMIDVFGYWNYGMESERNEYGIPWRKVKEAIEAIGVKIDDLEFEFKFTGDTFNDVPAYYRIEGDSIDIISLCEKVAADAGSDFVCLARKASSNKMLVEFRGIRRKDTNVLTRQEISNFITNRADIVENCKVGREYRNEPDSTMLFGGFKNSIYTAYPTEHYIDFHLNEDGKEDYSRFPADIKVRLFGGEYEYDDWTKPISIDGTTGEIILTKSSVDIDIDSGAIFPYWGTHPTKTDLPLIEPFLPLDHLVFDTMGENAAKIRRRIPLCIIGEKRFTVRNVEHQEVFLDGDEDADERPFAYVWPERRFFDIDAIYPYTRGLPLNTEVLRAAFVSEHAFWEIYQIYYPDIADSLGLPGIDFSGMLAYCRDRESKGQRCEAENAPIKDFLRSYTPTKRYAFSLTRNPDGSMAKTAWNFINAKVKEKTIMERVRSIIYEEVKSYAEQYMGVQFMVCLPKSAIMQRIWAGEDVPTRPEKPEIEYVIDRSGFWETIPAEFDAIAEAEVLDGTFTLDEEQSIHEKFRTEDGRFTAMVAIKWKPTGNINFNSNTFNKAMFQDFSPEDFRPNRIASGNTQHVFVACDVEQMEKRPDLALVTLPNRIFFDPTLGNSFYEQNAPAGDADDEFLIQNHGIVNMFWRIMSEKNDTGDQISENCWALRSIIGLEMRSRGLAETLENTRIVANEIFSKWAREISFDKNISFLYEHSTEPVMDLKNVFIPLTSTWVNYGPWYYTYDDARGNTEVKVDESLVPWNFMTPQSVDPTIPEDQDDGRDAMDRLDEAGFERLALSLSQLEYIDSATISVAGFPEMGPAQQFGFNNNVTSISVDFSVNKISTTYSLSTYAAKPGTYRKSEYDDLSRARIDSRLDKKTPMNLSIVRDLWGRRSVMRWNRFVD